MSHKRKIVITWLDYIVLSDDELHKKIEEAIRQKERSNKT